MRQVCLASVVLVFVATNSPASAQKKPQTNTPIPLIVTVHSVHSDPDGEGPLTADDCGICGDAYPLDTDYTDGAEGVKAVIDQYGNLIIDFQTSRTQERGLLFRDADGSKFSTGTNQYMATITRSTDPPFSPLQTAPLNVPQNVRSCPTYDDEVNQRRYVHSFQRDCFVSGSAEGGDSSFLVVTRILVDGDVRWTVETEGAQHEATVFHVPMNGRISNVEYVDRPLPFRMTLRAK